MGEKETIAGYIIRKVFKAQRERMLHRRGLVLEQNLRDARDEITRLKARLYDVGIGAPKD